MIHLNLNSAITQLKEYNATRVLVQIPEGLKTRTEDISELLKDFEVVINMDPCFGACDLKEAEAEILDCDALLHIGHSAFQKKTKMNVVYAPLPYTLNEFEEVAEKLINYLKENKINNVGLTTTVQFLDYLPKLKEKLIEQGITGNTASGNRTIEGQLLGCNYSAADVEGELIVYFGDGLFHPLGSAFSSKKEVVIVNPFTKEISSLGEEKDKFLKQRISLIIGAKEMKKFAILVSTKTGQSRSKVAFEIKKKLEEHGKRTIIYSADMLSPENLLGIDAEVLVNTACPRIALDDFKNYKQIVLNYYEIDYLFGKEFEEYEIPKEF
jgi:2-(3-amino-3-carboxypropyl)histidine synthase